MHLWNKFKLSACSVRVLFETIRLPTLSFDFAFFTDSSDSPLVICLNTCPKHRFLELLKLMYRNRGQGTHEHIIT